MAGVLGKLSLVFYTNRFIPGRFGGVVYGPVILIRPQYRQDRGLLEHERVHVEQFYRTLFLYPLIYWLSKKSRLAFEIRAYQEQLQWYPEDRTGLFALFLATKYGLSISVAEAEALLRG